MVVDIVRLQAGFGAECQSADVAFIALGLAVLSHVVHAE